MDIKKLTQEVLLKNMTPEQQLAVLESVTASVKEAKAVQKQKIAENVDLVLQALKRIEADMLKRVEGTAQVVEDRVKTIKDGKDGKNGVDGKPGKDGINGKDGKDGRDGKDGLNGISGERGQDGVSVINAHIDFDGSLIIQLSDGQELNAGEVVPFDMAEKIRVIGNGGGTSQYVVDTLASLQAQINAVSAGLIYKGTWNASTNTPTLTSGSGSNGWYYVVSVAGSTNLNGVTDWQVGDWAIFNGTVWQKIDQTNLVTSVNGSTGDVVLTTTNVSEGTNQYFTNARARGAVSAGTGISYNSTTGVITNSSPDQTVALTAGTGITTSGTYPNFTITNSAPDQTVSLTGAGTTTVTGTYPNFTITSADSATGTVTSVTGTSPVVSSGGNTPAISLATGYGDTQNPYASKTANYFLAAPNGSAGAPTFRAIVAADIPTLNQNTTGSAATVTTTISSGATATTQTAGDNSTKVATTAYVNAITGTSGLNGFKNRIINGAMMIDQRNAGVSVTVNADADFYPVDRFVARGQGSDGVFTAQQTAVSFTNFNQSIKCTVTTADASIGAVQYYFLSQRIEGFNAADFRWGTANAKAVTLSFVVQSSVTGTYGGCISNSGNSRSYPFTYTISAANTETTISVTIPGDTSGTWLTTNGVGMYVYFGLGVGSTYSGSAGSWAGATYLSATGATNWISTNGATFYITGVQLEKGSTATSFDYRPYGTELALCQRYFETSYDAGTAIGGASVQGSGTMTNVTTTLAGSTAGNAGGGSQLLPFKVSKRTNPTIVCYDYDGTANAVRVYPADAKKTGVTSVANIRMDGGYQFMSFNNSSATAIGSGNNIIFNWTASAEL